MKAPADMIEDECFSLAFLAGCAIDFAGYRIEDDNYIASYRTRWPVTITERNGRYVVYEARGIKG